MSKDWSKGGWQIGGLANIVACQSNSVNEKQKEESGDHRSTSNGYANNTNKSVSVLIRHGTP